MSSSSSSAKSRCKDAYADAYAVAASIVTFGGVLKAIGVVGAVLVVALAIISETLGATVVLGGRPVQIGGALVVGGLWWAFFYVGGVIVSAQGQLLNASLDTAVNTALLLEVAQDRLSIASQSLPEGFTARATSDDASARHLVYCEFSASVFEVFRR